MITRAALGLAALLVSAPLATAAYAADWDGSAQAAHWHARMHHGHHDHYAMHQRHHHHHAWVGAHRRVLYRNPAYSARWARPSPVAAHGWYDRQYGYAVRPVSYRYAYPVAGSYVGGGLIGALYNQPSCYCR
jgi:hypothetical protein